MFIGWPVENAYYKLALPRQIPIAYFDECVVVLAFT